MLTNWWVFLPGVLTDIAKEYGATGGIPLELAAFDHDMAGVGMEAAFKLFDMTIRDIDARMENKTLSSQLPNCSALLLIRDSLANRCKGKGVEDFL